MSDELRDRIIRVIVYAAQGTDFARSSWFDTRTGKETPVIDATADDILALVADALARDATVREVADVHECIVSNPLVSELLVRGILNTATYAAGIRTAPGARSGRPAS